MVEAYSIGEAKTHVIPYLRHEPSWFVIVGPGSGNEVNEVCKRWPKCKLLGIEPSRASFAAAKQIWPQHGCLLSTGLWSRPSILPVQDPDTLLKTVVTEEATSEEYIHCTTLDKICTFYGVHNGLLWVSINGGEAEVLKGGGPALTLGAFRSAVVKVRPKEATDVLTFMGGASFKLDHVFMSCPQSFKGLFVK